MGRGEHDAGDERNVFRVLADAMPQLVWTANDDGVVDYYNSRAADYGRVSGAGGHYAWQPLVHPDELEVTQAAWEEAARSGSVYEFRHRILMADGTYRWHLSRAVPVADAATGSTKWFGTATDVHEPTLAEHRYAEVAHVLQDALLPRALPQSGAFDLAAEYRPGTRGAAVGGDWFDAVAHGDTLTLVIGDVAGHGIEAAAMMGAARHSVATGALSDGAPEEILERTNRYLSTFDDVLVTCLVARVDLRRRRAEVATAGHPPPVVGGRATPPERVSLTPAAPLGVFEGTRYPTTRFELDEDAVLVLYTDGLVERRAVPIDLGIDKLVDAVGRHCGGDPAGSRQLCGRILGELSAGATDDIALLVAHVP